MDTAYGYGSFTTGVGNFPGGLDRNFAMQVPTVSRCRNLIAGVISYLPLKLYKKSNGEELENSNAVEVKRGIDIAVKEVVKYLQNDYSKEITEEDQLKHVATISGNNDTEVGNLIATAMDKVGRDGLITIEESKTGETYLETVEGMQFNRGMKSPYFTTDNATMTAVLNDPLILITDKRLTNLKELLPLLESVSQQSKSLLIIAEDIDAEVLSTLVVNKMRGILNVVAVKAPEFGDRKKAILEDIATLTGGMQDQMRFVDENGKWIDFDENFCSNHYGTYKECGEWAIPLFPTNQSIVGSIPTPYILDDRCSFIDAAEKLEQVYNMSVEERQRRGMAGRKWVLSEESMMSAEHMCDNVIESIEQTFDKFKPRKKFELIKIEKLPKNKIVHKLIY